MNYIVPTLAAVLPHAQVDLRDVVAAPVAVGQLGHLEDVLLDSRDVVSVVTQHLRQRGLLQLGQLGRSEHAWVLIPEPKRDDGGGVEVKRIKNIYHEFFAFFFLFELHREGRDVAKL